MVEVIDSGGIASVKSIWKAEIVEGGRDLRYTSSSLPASFELLIAPIIAYMHNRRDCNIDRKRLINTGPVTWFSVTCVYSLHAHHGITVHLGYSYFWNLHFLTVENIRNGLVAPIEENLQLPECCLPTLHPMFSSQSWNKYPNGTTTNMILKKQKISTISKLFCLAFPVYFLQSWICLHQSPYWAPR